MTFRFHLSKAEINIWPFELNYEHTKCKDLRVLSWKQISRDLRVFGVKFWTQIFIRVKNLTFCKSIWEVNMQISWGRHTFQITQPLTASLLGFVPTTITFSDTSLSILHTRDRREACISKMLYFVLPFRKRLFLGVDNCCVHETIQQTQQRYPQVLFLFLYFLSIFLFYIF